MNFIVEAVTDIGITKKTNQDSYNVRIYDAGGRQLVLAVLCDGMGGLSKGEVASGSLIKGFTGWAEERLPALYTAGLDENVIRNEWTLLIRNYNEKIKAYGNSCSISIGTTVTALLIADGKYYIANVGDTRCYEIAAGIKVLTKDQTVVAKEVEMGLLTEEQAKTDPRRSVLLQCVGASDEVNPEFFFGEAVINAVYMLCSDGFRHEITPDEIFTYLNPGVMLDENGMKANMTYLIDTDKVRQERDNITVVSVRTF